ncbi:MAG: hypothetical protein ACRCTE_08650 [Cellulosilyticaceae bacterium]
MIGGLFAVNVLLCVITFLTTSMLQNHFHRIHRSISIYLDAKAYKPNSEIAFISKVLKRYQEISCNCEDQTAIVPHVDVEVMINKALYEEKIGRFSYLGVQSIATRAKVVMWAILVIQIALEILSTAPGSSIPNFIFVVASTVVCILATLYTILKSVPEKRTQLIVKVHDYVVNTYPSDLIGKSKQQEIKELMERIQKLEDELENYHQNSEAPKDKLNGQEIMHLLKEIDLHV